MSRMLQNFPVYFQRLSIAPGGSTRHNCDMARPVSVAKRDLEALRRQVEDGRLTRSQAALKLRWRMRPDGGPQSVQDLLASPTDDLKASFRTSLTQRLGDRMRAFDKLLDELAAKHGIDDRFRLERAVDTAMLLYGHRGSIGNGDIKKLWKHLPEVIEVLGHDDNDRRLADMFLDRERNLIEGSPWNMEDATDITMRILRLKGELVDLVDLLRRPKRRKADLKLHATYSSLTRYWATLPGKTCTASPKSEMLRFISAVFGFIDPASVKKLVSVSRGRLSGVAKTRARPAACQIGAKSRS
jgi:hypothetical protein